MEDAVAKVVAPPWAAWATMYGVPALHATIVKQVHHVHWKMDTAKQLDGATPKNY